MANRLDVLPTAAQSAAREAEAWFHRVGTRCNARPPPSFCLGLGRGLALALALALTRCKAAIVSAVGVATQLPGARLSALRGAARGLVAKVLDLVRVGFRLRLRRRPRHRAS